MSSTDIVHNKLIKLQSDLEEDEISSKDLGITFDQFKSGHSIYINGIDNDFNESYHQYLNTARTITRLFIRQGINTHDALSLQHAIEHCFDKISSDVDQYRQDLRELGEDGQSDKEITELLHVKKIWFDLQLRDEYDKLINVVKQTGALLSDE